MDSERSGSSFFSARKIFSWIPILVNYICAVLHGMRSFVLLQNYVMTVLFYAYSCSHNFLKILQTDMIFAYFRFFVKKIDSLS